MYLLRFSVDISTGIYRRKKIMNWLFQHRINTGCNNNKNLKQIVRRLSRFASNITTLMIIGVILNVVSSYFYPDFPERFPTIYGWFDGWLQFGEFIFTATLNVIYSFFTGHWSKFWTEYNEAFQELFHQFTNWLNTLHF